MPDAEQSGVRVIRERNRMAADHHAMGRRGAATPDRRIGGDIGAAPRIAGHGHRDGEEIAAARVRDRGLEEEQHPARVPSRLAPGWAWRAPGEPAAVPMLRRGGRVRRRSGHASAGLADAPWVALGESLALLAVAVAAPAAGSDSCNAVLTDSGAWRPGLARPGL